LSDQYKVNEQIRNFIINTTDQHLLCKPLTDTFCNLIAGYTLGIFAYRSVRKRYLYHTVLCFSQISLQNYQILSETEQLSGKRAAFIQNLKNV
jgi:hypothetical protein